MQGAGQGNRAQNGQVQLLADGFVKQQGQEQDNGDQQALDPLQPAVDVALILRGFQRQHNVVQHHAGQGKGADNHQPAGGRQTGNVHQHGQGRVAQRLGNTDTEEGGRRGDVQCLGTPDNQRNRQAHQQQVQRQAPAGLGQRPG